MKKTFLTTILIAGVTFAVWAQTDRNATRPGVRLPASKTVQTVEKETTSKKRIREGTAFKNKRCLFRVSGNRVTLFSEDESERYFCLENLNLDRVMKVIQENPAQQIWNVDGFYTEYRGENFVYIQRAVLASRQTAEMAAGNVTK